MSRFKEIYKKQVIPAMKKKFNYTNDLAVPKLLKVTINSGIGKALKDDKYLDTVVDTLTRISGQKVVLTKAKKSVAAFKIREGMTIGVKVNLRNQRMYDFVEKLVNVSLARIRDFRGLDQKSVGHDGNLTIGFKEHIVFPEIKSDEIEKIHGLEVVITNSAKTKKEGLELFTLLGFPFKK